MEVLSCILKRAMEGSFLEDVLVNKSGGVERWPFPFAKSLMDDLNVKSLPPLSPTTRVVSLLNQVIVRKYEKEEGGWCSGSLREGYGVGLWKAIGKGGRILAKGLFLGREWKDSEILEGMVVAIRMRSLQALCGTLESQGGRALATFCALLGVQWEMPSLVKDVLLSWHGAFVGKRRKKMWKETPLCLF
ncbi:hypothetical protein CK203_092063 [Vitis vinifera]|uniref:Uncharacterized protein n=1 Tax=Vitis vinifera TaxID=29760 RepID=A0A438CLA8_VITVI|nr:hypothetical protein CK203_092063 [Vitis vinifera]